MTTTAPSSTTAPAPAGAVPPAPKLEKPVTPDPAAARQRPALNRAARILVGVIVGGAVLIALIGFAGSYAAVHQLALRKGFGAFAYVLPLGIDLGILILLALDLLLTWLRIPFAVLRHTAWLLTLATIAFNGAAAWPDPLAVGMHATIPVLFIVVVEAARHAVGQLADITAARHIEPVRLARWFLDPIRTAALWRRMKLWELTSYRDVIGVERDRMVFRARLRARYGRRWRSKAPVEDVLRLKLTRYGERLEPTTLDAHADAAMTVVSTMERAATPSSAPAFPDADGAPASLHTAAERPALDPAPAPAAASHGERKVTARVPEKVQEEGGVRASRRPEQAADDTSAKPQVRVKRASGSAEARSTARASARNTPRTTPQAVGLADANTGRRAVAEAGRAALAADWYQASAADPALTKAQFATARNTTANRLRTALKENGPPQTIRPGKPGAESNTKPQKDRT